MVYGVNILVFLKMKTTLVNFIIRIWCHITPTCSFVEAFLTTCHIDIAVSGNYDIHSLY